MEAEARSFLLLSTDSVLGTLPPSPLFIFITTPGVCIRSPLLVLRNETQGRWVICLRLQTSVTERAWDQDNLVEAPFISFYGALLPGTCLCHHFSLFLLLLLFMCLRVYLYFMFVYVYILSLFTHIFFFCFSLVAQLVKYLPAIQETLIQSLGQEDFLEKGMATHSSILAWRIPQTEEPGRLLSMGSQKVRQDWATNTFTFYIHFCYMYAFVYINIQYIYVYIYISILIVSICINL